MMKKKHEEKRPDAADLTKVKSDQKTAELKEKIFSKEESKPSDEEINSLNLKIDDLTDTLKRVQAEFENYQKRQEKDRISFAKFANAELIKSLLPVIDTFNQAIKSIKDDETRKGLELTHDKLMKALGDAGLRRIDCIGKQFDPYLHDVMLKSPSDKETDTILEELQVGYMLHDKVLRHSKVRTADKKGHESEGSTGTDA
jgi:molecular chaperone GrpE